MTSFNFTIDQYELIIFIVFSTATAVQIYYYLGIYSRFLFHRKEERKVKREPVSVIICARNEAENLDQYLPFFLEQEYPEYEVIVVNDCSDDETDMILGKYLKKYKHLKTTTITEDKKFKHGKKLALTVGIKAAKNEILLFSDADCKPDSNLWIEKMQQNFTDKVSIVLGYGGYNKEKGILNSLIRYDTVWIALQYFSFALLGIPYMGVGRNLAYRKSLFFESKGFAKHYHLQSGDDDLFVNENSTKENTKIEYSFESHTRSQPETTFGDWFKQKRRHLTTSKFYKKKHKFLLALENISRFFFYGALLWLLLVNYNLPYILAVFAFRLIIYCWFTKKLLFILKERNLLLSSLFFDIFSILIYICLFITGRIKLKKR